MKTIWIDGRQNMNGLKESGSEDMRSEFAPVISTIYVVTGSFCGFSHPTKDPRPPNGVLKHCKSVDFFSNFRM